MSFRTSVLLIVVALLANYINDSAAKLKTSESTKSEAINRYLREAATQIETADDAVTTRNGNEISAGKSRLATVATTVADTEERGPLPVLTKVESSVQKASVLAKLKSAFPKSIGLTKMKTLSQFQKQPAASKLTSFLQKTPSLSQTKTFIKQNPDVTKLKVDTSTKVTSKDVKRLRPLFSRVFGNAPILWFFLIYALTPAVILAVTIIIARKML